MSQYCENEFSTNTISRTAKDGVEIMPCSLFPLGCHFRTSPESLNEKTAIMKQTKIIAN